MDVKSKIANTEVGYWVQNAIHNDGRRYYKLATHRLIKFVAHHPLCEINKLRSPSSFAVPKF